MKSENYQRWQNQYDQLTQLIESLEAEQPRDTKALLAAYAQRAKARTGSIKPIWREVAALMVSPVCLVVVFSARRAGGTCLCLGASQK